MPDFETRTPQQRDRPNKLRGMLTTTKLRIGLVANELRSALIANRLRALLIGGGILLFVVAVPVVLLIYSPRWLGDQIVLARRVASGTDIYVIDGEGAHETRLTSTEPSEVFPGWSPDGEKIAFVRNSTELYVVNADGSGLKHLGGTTYEGAVLAPQFGRRMDRT